MVARPAVQLVCAIGKEQGMDIRYLDMDLKRGEVSFGAVLFGGTETFAVVTASCPDGRSWIISPNQRRISEEVVSRYAMALCHRARQLAAASACDRFVGEMLAYVRGLPMGRKSNFLSSTDHLLVREAEADVADALKAALVRDDPYRAAVEFETRVPYLIADRGLIDVMDAVHAAFVRDYREDEWLVMAAETTEDYLCTEHTYVAHQAAAWKSTAGGTFSTV